MSKPINDLLQDNSFVEKIVLLSDKNKIKEAFQFEGVDLSDNELKEIVDLIFELKKMDDSQLEKISGGKRPTSMDAVKKAFSAVANVFNLGAHIAKYRGVKEDSEKLTEQYKKQSEAQEKNYQETTETIKNVYTTAVSSMILMGMSSVILMLRKKERKNK